MLKPKRMKYLATAQFPDAVYIYLNICPMLKQYTNLVELRNLYLGYYKNQDVNKLHVGIVSSNISQDFGKN